MKEKIKQLIDIVMKKKENIKDLVIKEYEKGNIVVYTQEGLITMSLKNCLKQPVEGLLYDLNRDTGTILTFINDPKWINDYALTRVLIELKDQLEKIESPYLELTNEEIEKQAKIYACYKNQWGKFIDEQRYIIYIDSAKWYRSELKKRNKK